MVFVKIKVCASTEKIPDLVTWQIMRVTKYHASHVFLVYKDEVFECAGEGIARTCFIKFQEIHWVVEEVILDAPCTEEQFYDWFKMYEKLPYSESQWFGFILPKWLTFLFKNNRKGAICTEFVCWFLTDIMKFDVGEVEFKKPQEVIDFVKTKGVRYGLDDR